MKSHVKTAVSERSLALVTYVKDENTDQYLKWELETTHNGLKRQQGSHTYTNQSKALGLKSGLTAR